MKRIAILLGSVGVVFLCVSCAPAAMYDARLPEPEMYSQQHVEPSIIIRTKDQNTMQFADGWNLTFKGVSGTAEYQDNDRGTIVTDTTLSYGDIVNAAPARRTSTMRQFLLTILGVILVIGLAAIILYAAFIATDR